MKEVTIDGNEFWYDENQAQIIINRLLNGAYLTINDRGKWAELNRYSPGIEPTVPYGLALILRYACWLVLDSGNEDTGEKHYRLISLKPQKAKDI